MRHISPAFAALAAILTTITCPCPVLSQAVSLKLMGIITDPMVCDGVVYFSSNDGKLYGLNTSDGTPAPGFPVDIVGAIGDGSYAISRPSVYAGSHGKAIYSATSRNGVVKIWPNGTVAWINKLDGATVGSFCTPAVTPQGEVITQMTTKDRVYLAKLQESDGSLIGTSPPIGDYSSSISAPAIANGNVYITIWPYGVIPTDNHTAVLDLADLTVKATYSGSYSDKNPPYVRGNGVYMGSFQTGGATVFKLNSATLAPDPQFGPGPPGAYPGTTWVLPGGFGAAPGEAEVCPSPASADRDPGGTVYASVYMSDLARVVAIDAVTGTVRVLYNTGGFGSRGLVVSMNNVIAYGEDLALHLFSVDGGHNMSFTLPGHPGRPCFDPTTNRFFLTTSRDSTGASYLLGFDSP